MKNKLCQACANTHYGCMAPKAEHPALFIHTQQHTVLRTKEQWRLLIGPVELHCATQNAMNAWQRFHHTRHRTPAHDTLPLHEDDTDFVIPSDAILSTLERSNTQQIQKYPFVAHGVYDMINDRLKVLNLQAKLWDQQPCNRMPLRGAHATCNGRARCVRS